MTHPSLALVAMLLVTAGGACLAHDGESAVLSMPSKGTEGMRADAHAAAAGGVTDSEAARATEASTNAGTGGADSADDDDRLGLGAACGMPDRCKYGCYCHFPERKCGGTCSE